MSIEGKGEGCPHKTVWPLLLLAWHYHVCFDSTGLRIVQRWMQGIFGSGDVKNVSWPPNLWPSRQQLESVSIVAWPHIWVMDSSSQLGWKKNCRSSYRMVIEWIIFRDDHQIKECSKHVLEIGARWACTTVLTPLMKDVAKTRYSIDELSGLQEAMLVDCAEILSEEHHLAHAGMQYITST